jgi:hypothetical protein
MNITIDYLHNLSMRDQYLKNFLDYHLSLTRVFCLTEDNLNLPMWGHYANNHKGVVFSIKYSKEIDNPECVAIKVNYSDERPELFENVNSFIDSLLGITDSPKINFRGIFCTKAMSWSYEQEWRVMIPCTCENDSYKNEFISFHPQEIDQIFLGYQITDADKTEILDFPDKDYAHTTVYKSIFNNRTKNIEFIKLKSTEFSLLPITFCSH